MRVPVTVPESWTTQGAVAVRVASVWVALWWLGPVCPAYVAVFERAAPGVRRASEASAVASSKAPSPT